MRYENLESVLGLKLALPGTLLYILALTSRSLFYIKIETDWEMQHLCPSDFKAAPARGGERENCEL